MSETQRCKATKVILGEVKRCEGIRGHNSAHFCEHEWWANENGLPGMVTPRTSTTIAVLMVGIVAALMGLAIYFLLYHHHP
jgi:hypothetical protein